jgi:uncharacterized RDD family membrane protein YckC
MKKGEISNSNKPKLPDSASYAGIQIRSIANLIDFVIVAIFSVPLFVFVSHLVYTNVPFPAEILSEISYEAENLIKSGQKINPIEFMLNNSKFKEYFITQHGYIRVVIDRLLQIFFLGGVFLCFWIKKQATLGKIFLSLKIVDATNFTKPTNKQLIIRLFGCIISALPLFLGFIWVAFDSKKQGWHDKMANTLVIKEKK